MRRKEAMIYKALALFLILGFTRAEVPVEMTTPSYESSSPFLTTMYPSNDNKTCPMFSSYNCNDTWEGYSFGSDYRGDIRLTDFQCDSPPIARGIGKDCLYDFPTGSKVEIQCISYPGICKPKTLKLNLAKDYVRQETEFLGDNVARVTVEFVKPFNVRRKWMICSCDTNKTKDMNVANLVMVGSGYKPRPVQNFTCTMLDFDGANCTWESQSDLNVTWSYCIGLSRTPNTSYRECASPNNTDIELQPVHWNGRYVAILNGTNEYGHTSSEVHFAMDKVKLSAPKIALKQMGSLDAYIEYHQECAARPYYQQTCILVGLQYRLTLSIDETLTPDLKKLIKIHVADRTKIINGTYGGHGSITRKDTKDPIRIDLTGLLPYTDYKLNISQRILSQEHWSEPTIIEFKTNAIAPSQGPFLHPNSFSQDLSSRCRRINVYWKRLDPHNGGNGVVTAYALNNKNLPPNLREDSVCVPKNGSDLSVYAITKQGQGRSFLEVPPVEGLIDLPTCLLRVREARDDPTKVTVNWQMVSIYLQELNMPNASLTLFWCHFVDNLCQNEFDWQDITNNNQTELEWKMNYNATDYRYGIGVAYGEAKSGISWAECLLGFSGPSSDDVSISVRQIKDENLAQVTVRAECRPKMGMLSNNSLIHCQVGKEGSCKTEPPSLAHCSKDYEVAIEPGVEYSFTVLQTYADGRTLKQHPIEYTVPNKKVKDQKIIIGSICSGMSIIVIIVTVRIILYVRRKRKQSRKLKVTTIRPPEMKMIDEMVEFDSGSSDSEEDNSNSYLSYRVAKSMAAHHSLLAPNDCPKLLKVTKTEDGAQIMHETCEKNDQQDDSDYGTTTADNSGNSFMGYTKVTDLLLANNNGVNPLDSTMLSFADEFNSATTTSSTGSLFHGTTLEDMMKPSSTLQAVPEENCMKHLSELSDDYMEVSKVLPEKSESTESLQSNMHSGYVKVERISEDEKEESLHVDTSEAGEELGERNPVKGPFIPTSWRDDFTSAGTLDSYQLDMSQSGISSIDMLKYLNQSS